MFPLFPLDHLRILASMFYTFFAFCFEFFLLNKRLYIFVGAVVLLPGILQHYFLFLPFCSHLVLYPPPAQPITRKH